jgi:hypothetical protein
MQPLLTMRALAFLFLLLACLRGRVGAVNVRGDLAKTVSMGTYLLKDAELKQTVLKVASLTRQLATKANEIRDLKAVRDVAVVARDAAVAGQDAAVALRDAAVALSTTTAAAYAELSAKVAVAETTVAVAAVVIGCVAAYEGYHFVPTDHFKVGTWPLAYHVCVCAVAC